jgi:hypothetical protein
MDDKVVGDTEGGYQEDQQENENGIPVHPPVVQEKDERQKNIQYGYVKRQSESRVKITQFCS